MIITGLVLVAGCRKKTPPPPAEDTQAAPQPAQEQQEQTAAGREDVLRLMVWGGYEPKEYVEEFEKEIEARYGRQVKMDVILAGSSDDFYAAIRNKSVDLVTISHHTIKDGRFNFISKKLILPFDLENIPNHANVIDELKMADYHVSDGKVYGIPIANGPYGLAYNTEKVTGTPDSWNIFWDPEFKGKYVLGAQEYLYNVNITALVLGYPRDSISHYDALNNNEFREKLRQLAVNAHAFWIGVDTPEDLFGQSLAASWGDSLSGLERMGEAWKMADPKEGTMWWIDEYAMTWALTDKPFMKKVAEEWINKSLSTAFQVDHLVRELQVYPAITHITDLLTDEEKGRVLTNGGPGGFSEKRILQHTYSQRDRNALKLLWEEAMKGIVVEKEQ